MVSVDRNVLVEMPDGVTLATDVRHPDGKGPFPTLLQRTCYDKDLIAEYSGLEAFLAAGYPSYSRTAGEAAHPGEKGITSPSQPMGVSPQTGLPISRGSTGGWEPSDQVTWV